MYSQTHQRTFRSLLLLVIVTGLCVGAWTSVWAASENELMGKPPAYESAGWILESRSVRHDLVEYKLHHSEYGDLTVALAPRNDTQPAFAKSRSFNIFYMESDLSSEKQKVVASLMEAIAKAVEINDDGSFRFPEPVVQQPVEQEANLTSLQSDQEAMPRPPGSEKWLSQQLWNVMAFGEIGSAIFWLPFALVALFSALVLALREIGAMPRAPLAITILFLALALVLRVVMPHRLVMEYSGYGLIEQARTLTKLMRYGAGMPVLYYLPLNLFPPAGVTYLAINSIAGWLTLPLGVAWLRRHFSNAWIVAAFAFLIAVNPLILKDHMSESNLIPALLFFITGLLHWQQYMESGRRRPLFFTLSALGFAAFCRPMFLLFAVAALAVSWKLSDRNNKLRLPLWVAVFTLPLLPHLAYIGSYLAVDSLINRSSGFGLQMLYSLVWPTNLFWDIRFTSFLPPLFFIIAWFYTDKRKLLLPALIGAFIIGLYFFDAPNVSRPRLQAPGQYFLLMVSSAGAVGFIGSFRIRSRIILWAGLFALVYVLSLYPVSKKLWRPTVADEEEKALSTISEKLPDQPVALGWLHFEDEPRGWGIFRNYPDWRFQPPVRNDRLLSLSDWIKLKREHKLGAPGYVYLGTRCYAYGVTIELHIPPPLEPSWEHPMCRALRKTLEPVWEQDITNHEAIPYYIHYPAARKLRIGLYKAGLSNPADLR